MGTIRRRRPRATELDGGELWELLIGPGVSSVFASDRERKQAWEQHREALMADGNPTTRPWGWWAYESKEPWQPGWGGTASLVRQGEATAAEIEAMRSWLFQFRKHRARFAEPGELTEYGECRAALLSLGHAVPPPI